jgi:D-arginine dehydrogenase
MEHPTYDVTIVGAGIAGAALAWQLAPHMRVLLLERESQPGLHSTGRSAAMFMESYGSPQGRALTRASRAFYAQPPAGFSETPLLTPRGVLYVGWRAQEASLDALRTALAETGSVSAWLEPADVLERLPVLRGEGLLGAWHEPDAMDIDVHALHQGYLKGCRRAGGTLWCDAELATAHHDGDGWTVTLADARTLRCRRLVNAAGAWADTVAQRCGVAGLGLQPKRRSAFTFPALPGADTRAWPAVVDADERWYFKPDATQLLGSPANADPVAAHDVVAEEIDIATGIAGIEAATTLTIRRPTRTWAGLRTFAPDGEMVIGADPRCSDFVWVAGQGGWGIQSAHGAGMLAASLVLGEALPGQLSQCGVQLAATSAARWLQPGGCSAAEATA